MLDNSIGIAAGITLVLFFQYTAYKCKSLIKRGRNRLANKDKIHALKCFNNGKLSFRNKEYDIAVQHFMEALHYGYAAHECHHYMGRIHLNKDEYYKAISKFETVLDQKPEHTNSHFYSALAKRIVGDYKDSKQHFIDYFDTLNDEHLFNIVSYYETAFEHLEKNKFIDAMHHFMKARRYIMENQ